MRTSARFKKNNRKKRGGVMVRGGQALILQAAEINGLKISQSKISLYLSGNQGLKYSVAVNLAAIFEGTTADDWMARRLEKIERSVVKWGLKNCPAAESRRHWENYRFK